jgi:hypothetical protein
MHQLLRNLHSIRCVADSDYVIERLNPTQILARVLLCCERVRRCWPSRLAVPTASRWSVVEAGKSWERGGYAGAPESPCAPGNRNKLDCPLSGIYVHAKAQNQTHVVDEVEVVEVVLVVGALNLPLLSSSRRPRARRIMWSCRSQTRSVIRGKRETQPTERTNSEFYSILPAHSTHACLDGHQSGEKHLYN